MLQYRCPVLCCTRCYRRAITCYHRYTKRRAEDPGRSSTTSVCQTRIHSSVEKQLQAGRFTEAKHDAGHVLPVCFLLVHHPQRRSLRYDITHVLPTISSIHCCPQHASLLFTLARIGLLRILNHTQQEVGVSTSFHPLASSPDTNPVLRRALLLRQEQPNSVCQQQCTTHIKLQWWQAS